MKVIIETLYNRMGQEIRVEIYLENELGVYCLLKVFESGYEISQALFYAQKVANVLQCEIDTCKAVVKR